MLRIFFCIGLCLSFMSVSALDTKVYLRTEALEGDGIFSMMRRFHLDAYSCNFDKFYALNKIKKNTGLVAGKEYLLPVIIYRFNGKTIRSSIGISDYDKALRIQEYNEYMTSTRIRTASFRDNGVLWVPFHELNCPNADLEIPKPVSENPEATAAAIGSRVYPIFGAQYEKTPLLSNKLRNKVYYIVGGHGGPDPGAIGYRGSYTLCEDEYAYDVALRLCRKLVSHGATAYMITRDPNDGIRSDKFLKCDEDEVLWGNVKMVRAQRARLFQRSEIVNELYQKHQVQGVISQEIICIHVDSRSKKEKIDVFFYYEPDMKESKKLAQKMHKTMKTKYKKYQKNRKYHGTVSNRDLHMLRETTPNGVYIELANIRNTYDQQRIILEQNREALSQWLFEGLTK